MKILKILKGETKSVIRDPLSLFLFFIPFILYLLVTFLFPVIRNMLLDKIDIVGYYDFITMIFYIVTPTLLGIVLGLLLMDERDQDVLSYISVTPFSLKGYILLKTVTGGIIGFIFNLCLALLIGDGIALNVILTFILASLLVPLFCFTIFCFAKNKVEGLTKGKLLTFVIAGAIISHFVDSNWSYIAGILPTFWIEKIFFSSNVEAVLTMFLPGLSISILYLVLLLNLVKRTI